jgi:hypothetical protein
MPKSEKQKQIFGGKGKILTNKEIKEMEKEESSI